MKTFLSSILIFLSLATTAIAQNKELYFVSVETSFIRSGPGTNYNVVAELTKGNQVLLISEDFGEWWTVEYKSMNGFIKSADILAVPSQLIVQPKEEDLDEGDNENYDNWESKTYSTGVQPECLASVPVFDRSLDNFLKIKNVGSNTEAVVKLIKIDNADGNEATYRIIYIKDGDVFEMKNIPSGKYYLKIAYGKDWRETTKNGTCSGKFIQNPQYEKGDSIVDFTPVKTSKGLDVPSYELSLDVSQGGSNNGLSTENISVEDFNN